MGQAGPVQPDARYGRFDYHRIEGGEHFTLLSRHEPHARAPMAQRARQVADRVAAGGPAATFLVSAHASLATVPLGRGRRLRCWRRGGAGAIARSRAARDEIRDSAHTRRTSTARRICFIRMSPEVADIASSASRSRTVTFRSFTIRPPDRLRSSVAGRRGPIQNRSCRASHRLVRRHRPTAHPGRKTLFVNESDVQADRKIAPPRGGRKTGRSRQPGPHSTTMIHSAEIRSSWPPQCQPTSATPDCPRRVLAPVAA
jgi:hypothetical protein